MPTGKRVDVAPATQAVLDGLVAHFAAAGVDLPPYRAILPGLTDLEAWDEPALLVTVPAIRWGTTSNASRAQPTGPAVGMTTRRVMIGVQLLRVTIDQAGPVTADRITPEGLAAARDAGLVSQAVAELCDTGGVLARYGEALPGDVVAIGPMGGIVGCETNLTISVLSVVGP